MGLQPILERLHWFQWELCCRHHNSIDSAVTLTLDVNRPLHHKTTCAIYRPCTMVISILVGRNCWKHYRSVHKLFHQGRSMTTRNYGRYKSWFITVFSDRFTEVIFTDRVCSTRREIQSVHTLGGGGGRRVPPSKVGTPPPSKVVAPPPPPTLRPGQDGGRGTLIQGRYTPPVQSSKPPPPPDRPDRAADGVLDMPRSVCLLRSRRRTFLLKLGLLISLCLGWVCAAE